MALLQRAAAVGGPRHITQRGNFSRDVFVDDEDRFSFMGLLARYSSGAQLEILGFRLRIRMRITEGKGTRGRWCFRPAVRRSCWRVAAHATPAEVPVDGGGLPASLHTSGSCRAAGSLRGLGRLNGIDGGASGDPATNHAASISKRHPVNRNAVIPLRWCPNSDTRLLTSERYVCERAVLPACNLKYLLQLPLWHVACLTFS